MTKTIEFPMPFDPFYYDGRFYKADEVDAEIKRLKAALEAARHALVVTHNYRATDLDVETFDAHLGNDVPRDQLEFSIDNSKEIAVIDAALASPQEAA